MSQRYWIQQHTFPHSSWIYYPRQKHVFHLPAFKVVSLPARPPQSLVIVGKMPHQGFTRLLQSLGQYLHSNWVLAIVKFKHFSDPPVGDPSSSYNPKLLRGADTVQGVNNFIEYFKGNGRCGPPRIDDGVSTVGLWFSIENSLYLIHFHSGSFAQVLILDVPNIAGAVLVKNWSSCGFAELF